jgi:hypothetical protein
MKLPPRFILVGGCCIGALLATPSLLHHHKAFYFWVHGERESGCESDASPLLTIVVLCL